MSQRIAMLVHEDVEKSDEIAYVAEKSEAQAESEKPITERQEIYIRDLYRMLGENVPADVSKMSCGNANFRIRELKTKVEKQIAEVR